MEGAIIQLAQVVADNTWDSQESRLSQDEEKRHEKLPSQ